MIFLLSYHILLQGIICIRLTDVKQKILNITKYVFNIVLSYMGLFVTYTMLRMPICPLTYFIGTPINDIQKEKMCKLFPHTCPQSLIKSCVPILISAKFQFVSKYMFFMIYVFHCQCHSIA